MGTKAEQDNRKRYKIPNTKSYNMRSLDAIHINTSYSVHHELSKSLGAILLKKYGDVKFSDEVKKLLLQISSVVMGDYEKWAKSPSHFITEAQSKEYPDKIRDLVRLSDGWIYEFETSRSRSLRFKNDVQKNMITVINL